LLVVNYFGYCIGEYIMSLPKLQMFRIVTKDDMVFSYAATEMMDKIIIFIPFALIMGLITAFFYNLLIARFWRFKVEIDASQPNQIHITKIFGPWLAFCGILFLTFGLWPLWEKLKDMMEIIQPLSEIVRFLFAEVIAFAIGIAIGAGFTPLFNCLARNLRLLRIEFKDDAIALNCPFGLALLLAMTFTIFIISATLFAFSVLLSEVLIYLPVIFGIGYVLNLIPAFMLTGLKINISE